MDIDLPEDAVTGIKEAMRCIRGNDDDAAGLNFAGVITDGDGRITFDSECHLDVRMHVQRWTLGWFSFDKVCREGCALFVAMKFI